MPIKPSTGELIEQFISGMLQKESLFEIGKINDILIEKGFIEKNSKRDKILTFLFGYILGLFASLKTSLEPDMSNDEYGKEILDIIMRRAPEIKNAIV
ncbi:MAG: hypothetical protein H3Z53_08920 [archaeon]|nr:hypothetical protein [archaeon]MCP8314474.1 hypothetical protein [archaeon]